MASCFLAQEDCESGHNYRYFYPQEVTRLATRFCGQTHGVKQLASKFCSHVQHFLTRVNRSRQVGCLVSCTFTVVFIFPVSDVPLTVPTMGWGSDTPSNRFRYTLPLFSKPSTV